MLYWACNFITNSNVYYFGYNRISLKVIKKYNVYNLAVFYQRWNFNKSWFFI